MKNFEDTKSMNEFFLGAYLTLLMDMITSPEDFGPIPDEMWEDMKKTTTLWWDKYYETL